MMLLSDYMPWAFGPYQQQLGLLASGLIAREHEVYWLCPRLPTPAEGQTSFPTPKVASKLVGSIPPSTTHEEMFAKDVMVGGGTAALAQIKLPQLREELAARDARQTGMKATLQRRLHALLDACAGGDCAACKRR